MLYDELPKEQETTQRCRAELFLERYAPIQAVRVPGETRRWQSNASEPAKSIPQLAKIASQATVKTLKCQAL